MICFQFIAVADLHSKILDAPGSRFFQFHAIFGKIGELAPPPGVNPGSATALGNVCVDLKYFLRSDRFKKI